MKKGLLFLLGFGILTNTAFSQDDQAIKDATNAANKEITLAKAGEKAWTKGATLNFNFGQVALVNWAAGGQNTISAQVSGNGFVNYKKGRISWENMANANLGYIAQGRLRNAKANSYPFRKNVDLLQITSNFGYALDKKAHWFAAIMADYKTNMANGYDYSKVDDGTGTRQRLRSSFNPGVFTLALGIKWKPVPYFRAFYSPLAGKLTYGFATSSIDPTQVIDVTKFGITTGKNIRLELGQYLRLDFQKDIVKNVNFQTSLEFFNGYLEKAKVDDLVAQEVKLYGHTSSPLTYDNRKNIDVYWNTMITFKVNKFFNASLTTNLIYDHDQIIPKLKSDGTSYQGRGTQFREGLTLGVSYKF